MYMGNIANVSTLLDNQALIYNRKMYDALAVATNDSDIMAAINDSYVTYYKRAGKPIFNKRYPTTGGIPIVEDFNLNNAELTTDLEILFQEYLNLNEAVKTYFNSCRTKHTSLENKIYALNSLCADFEIAANIATTEDITNLSEQFTNTLNIDSTTLANVFVSTQYGFISLPRTKVSNLSQNASITIDPASTNNLLSINNGIAGNYYLVDTVNGTPQFRSTTSAHDKANAVLDGAADTWFEYEMVNIPDTNHNTSYDVSQFYGAQAGEILQLRLRIDLGALKQINWIDINPYYPNGGTGDVRVYSIKTSADNVTYTSIFEDTLILNEAINKFPQTYSQKETSNTQSLAGHGVWNFDIREARYVEVVLQQPTSYTCDIGHTYYNIETISGSTKKTTKVPEKQAPAALVNGTANIYKVSDTISYTKNIEVFSGWRYAIGLKDISVNSFEYAPSGGIVSYAYNTDKPIKSVMLYATEKFPQAILDDIKHIGTYAIYEIQVNGGQWMPISPMHRRPVGDETSALFDKADIIAQTKDNTTSTSTMLNKIKTDNLFPPKIYHINSVENVDLDTKDYSGYIYTSSDAKTIRLRITLSRPDGITTCSPIIENYTLKLVF